MKNIIFSFLVSCAAIGAPYKLKTRLERLVIPYLPANARVEIEILSNPFDDKSNLSTRIIHTGRPLGLVSFGASGSSAIGKAFIRAYAPVAVTTVSLKHGERISQSAIRFEERELSPLVQSGFFSDVNSVTALETRGALASGTMLHQGNTQPPLLVHPGETLELIHQNGSLVVTVKVKALQGGRLNDWISIQNPSSKKILKARVSAEGTVETHS